jgi:hypothetical protein
MSTRWQALAVAVCMFFVGACSSDRTTGPRALFEETFQRQPHLEDLPLTPASINRCNVMTFERGRPESGHLRKDSIPDAPGRAGTYQRFRFLRWDLTAKQPLVQATCVIPTDSGSARAARSFFEAFGTQSKDARGLHEVQASWTGSVNCFYYASTDQLECGGVTCWNVMSVKVPSDSVAFYSYAYECGNGCTVYDFSVFSCPTGGPGDVEGGGAAPEPGDGTPDTPPADVTMEMWASMNKEEQRLCWEAPGECVDVYYAAKEALNRSRNQAIADGFTSIADNKYDAIRHAFWNAIMIRVLPFGRAETWATAHEYGIPMNGSKCMDLKNNEVGRTVGRQNLSKSYDELWELFRGIADASPPGLQLVPGCP